MNMLAAAERGRRIEYIYGPTERGVYSLDDGTSKPSIELSGFIAGACDFLATRAKQLASVGSPYVAHDDAGQLLEFSATIRVTGERSGTVYFSVSRAMLTIMMMRMGATDITHDSMRRLLGEFAAHIATGARRAIGGEFVVRDPVITMSKHVPAATSAGRALVAPIQWRKFTAKLTLCMD